MKFIYSLLFSFLVIYTSAQCDDLRYKTEIFDSVTVSSDVFYGSNTNIYNIEEDLEMDIYEPFGDTLSNRALIIFAHGGSFVFGDKADESMVLIGTDFAKMGYVTASINYRLGLTTNLLGDLPDSVDAFAAIVRGVHDFKAAIRYFKQDALDNNNQYNIDPDKILIGGFSAGGFIVLHQAYMDEESEWPVFDSTVLGVDGGIAGNSGNPGYDTDFIAGLSLAGAIGDTSWIQTGDEPMMSTHGTDDNVVPYGSAVLSFTLGALIIDIALVHGSSSVHERLDNVNVPNCFTTWEGQGHVPEADLGPYYDTTFVKARNFFASIICNEDLNCEYEDIVNDIAIEEFKPSIKVYPNPFNDEITLDGINELNVRSIELFSLNGQKIQEWQGNDLSRLNLSNIDRGMYLLRIYEIDHGYITLKISKK